MPRDNTDRCGIYYQGSAVSFAGGLVGHNQSPNQEEEEESSKDEGYLHKLFHP